MQEKPFFLSNPEWYTFDEENFKYVLTDKAPKEAQKSYKEFYRENTKVKNGELYIND